MFLHISADLVGDQWRHTDDERQDNRLIFLYLSCFIFKYLQVGRPDWRLLNTYSIFHVIRHCSSFSFPTVVCFWKGCARCSVTSKGDLASPFFLFSFVIQKLYMGNKEKSGHYFLTMWWVDTGWVPGGHQSLFTTSLIRWMGGRKYNKRLLSQVKDRERSLTITGKKHTWLGEN